MVLEQQIQAECAAGVADEVTRTLVSNLVGLAVVAGALLALSPWQIVIWVVLFRLGAIFLTHTNSLRIRKAVASGSDMSGPLRLFEIGAAVAGLSCWASIVFAVRPDDITTFPGIALAMVMLAGLSMIMMYFAPLPRAFLLFGISYLSGTGVYILLNRAEFGLLPIVVIGAISLAVFSSVRSLSRSARNSARANIENARLSKELQAALAEAERLSRTDMLTGLANRRAFEDYIGASLSERADGTLILLDLDHFKRINDETGHAVGDAVLVAVGKILAAIAAPPGAPDILAARIGGEEFAIFVPGAGTGETEALAEDIRQTIGTLNRRPMFRDLRISASLGIARRLPGESLAALQRRADAALYEAKHRGRNQVRMAA